MKLTDILRESNDKLGLNSLVGKRLKIEVGSSTKSGTWNRNDLIDEIESALRHNLFDSDFSLNWTDNGREYAKVFDTETLKPLLKNIDSTLNQFFVLQKSPSGDTLKFSMSSDANRKFIDNWFMKNRNIDDSLRDDYRDYRKEYAGVTL